MPRAGELIVRLKRAKGVKGDEIFGFGKADMYAHLSLGGEKRTSKVVADGGSETVWDEEFSFKIAAYVNLALYQSLKIFIYDQDYGGDSRRGTAKIELKAMLEEHNDEVPDKEYPVMFHGEQRGALVVGFCFKPANVQPVVQPELTTVKSEKEEESTLEHMISKFQHMGHHKRKPRKLVSAEHTVVGSEEKHQVHAEQEKEKEKESDEEEEHRGWTSESESEYESEVSSQSSGDDE